MSLGLAVALYGAVVTACYVGAARSGLVPSMSPVEGWSGGWLLVLPFLVLVNALFEESVYRGIVQTTLEARRRPHWFPILGQGVFYGLLHVQGTPGGLVAAAMAFGWGTLLGWSRGRGGGLGTPIVGRVLLDGTRWFVLAMLGP